MTLGLHARLAVALLAAAGACHTVPSAVPLANTGAPPEDTGTARDRRAPVEVAGEQPKHEAHPAETAASHTPPSAPSASAAEAKPPAAGADDAGTRAPWPGDYYGSDKLVRHVDEEPDDVELDDKAHTRVERKSNDSLVISIVNSASGDVICALTATADGTQASLDPGQSCFGEQGLVATVTGGSATLSGDRLTLDFSGKLVPEDTGDDDEGDFELALEYHFEGRRQ